MNIVDTVRDKTTSVLGRARSKALDARTDRARARLFRELGEASFAKSKGVETSDAEIDRLLAEIDALDSPPSDEASPDADR